MGVSDLRPLVRPFVAERFAQRDRLSDLLSPPYDVISPAQRAELMARDPNNIVHLILPEGPGDRYEHAARLLETWRGSGALECDPGATVSVLRHRFTTPDGTAHVRTGLVAAVCAEPYAYRRVRPHERTHSGPKEDRLRLVRATRTALEPLFFLSRDVRGGLDDLLRRETSRAPDVEAALADEELSLWIVPADRADGALDSLRSDPLYIADGHHRYETAAAYATERRDADWIMGFITSTGDPGLVVLPTHRVVVDGRSGRSAFEPVVARAGDRAPPDESDCTVVWPDGDDLSLRLRGGADTEPLVARVERILVTPLVTASQGSKLVHTHDEHAARLRVRSGGVAVLLRPTSVEEVLAVADAGGTMPPKSTFFYPKVPSGLVIGPLE